MLEYKCDKCNGTFYVDDNFLPYEIVETSHNSKYKYMLCYCPYCKSKAYCNSRGEYKISAMNIINKNNCKAGPWCNKCKHCKIIDDENIFNQYIKLFPKEKYYELRYNYYSCNGSYFGEGYICNKYLKENICAELEENT